MKKIVSFMLATCIACGAFALCAFAEESDLQVQQAWEAVQAADEGEIVQLDEPAEDDAVLLPEPTAEPEPQTAIAEAADDETAVTEETAELNSYNAAPIAIAAPETPSEAEVIAKYNDSYIDVDKGIVYTETPDVSGNYTTAGKVDSGLLQDALTSVNLVRYIAGLDSVTLNETYNTYSQYGSTLLATINQLTHTPAKPDNCPQEFYNSAYLGTSKANLGYGYGNIAKSVLYGYMYDGDASNIDRVGHRRWILNPTMGEVGFGYANRFTSTYAHDSSNNNGKKPGYVAWPAAITPYELWTGPMSFQFKCGYHDTISNASATIYSKLQDKTYTYTPDNGLYANVAGYGAYYGCIIFGNHADFSAGDSLTVTVSYDVGGQSYSTTYTVKLLDMLSVDNIMHISNQYIVTLDPNGGSLGSASNKLIITSGSYISGLPTLTREGYNFDGWYTLSGIKIENRNIVTATSNATLRAKWSKQTCWVSFNPNGGQSSPSAINVTYGSTYGTLPSGVTRSGYTFAGWYTAMSGGTKVTASTVVKTGTAHTLYAHWTLNPTPTPTAKPTAAPTAAPTVAPTVAPTATPATGTTGGTTDGTTGGSSGNGTTSGTTDGSTGGNTGTTDTTGVEGFVDRLYSVCLGRAADAAGKADWVGQLTSYQISGTKAAYGFIFSQEFTNMNYSNADYVEHLYAAFMGRASDEAGKADWVGKLDAGASREDVFNGFANSVEFDNICKSYGIVSKDIETFVTRLYAVCLDRQPDDAGLVDWADKLRRKVITGRAAANGFVFSSEFISKNYSNDDYVEHLYAAFMGRAGDASGKSYWVSILNAGASREAVFSGFAGSTEFDNICSSYGIIRG